MRQWFREFKKSLYTEIKHSVFTSFFHFIRFGGLLLIPLLYGFSYIFAFWDPFEKMDRLPIAVVTKKADPFGEALGKALSKKNFVNIGDVEMTVKATHIYYDNDDLDASGKFDLTKKDLSDYNSSFVIPDINQDLFEGIYSITDQKINLLKIGGISQIFNALSANKIQIINNFKKNYLIAFGMDVATAMSGTKKLMTNIIVDALSDPQLQLEYKKYVTNDPNKTYNAQKYDKLVDALTSLQAGTNEGLYKTVQQHTQMHEHAKYGYGLAPFFVSIAMWMGGLVLSLSIHRKIYDKTIGAGIRYFSKWIILVTGVILQATILMTALYLIGFNKLDLSNWFAMYGFAIFSGIIFTTIIQGIRFGIPSKNLGIFLCVFLLIIQMISAGGLFPIQTQAKIYRVLNVLLPMGHSVNIYRELIFETRWNYVFEQCGYLLIYPAIITPLAIWKNKQLTKQFYIMKNWDLTPLLRKGGKK